MRDIILFIVEGKETEPEILENLWSTFFNNESSSELHVSYNSNIHLLWNEMKDDEDLELLELIAERDSNNAQIIEDIKERISEIYLIFDYDGHAAEASDQEISEMIKFFDNETDSTRGKLFLSYPMVEAFRHFNPEEFNYRDLVIDFIDSFEYKDIVHSKAKYFDIRKINGEIWNKICEENLYKANFIVNKNDSLPDSVESVSQEKIFNCQLRNFISDNKISVLSSFPLFLHYYNPMLLNRFR